jgi:hypothetical protein
MIIYIEQKCHRKTENYIFFRAVKEGGGGQKYFLFIRPKYCGIKIFSPSTVDMDNTKSEY